MLSQTLTVQLLPFDSTFLFSYQKMFCLHMMVSYRFSPSLLIFALNIIMIFDLVSLGKINALGFHMLKLGR